MKTTRELTAITARVAKRPLDQTIWRSTGPSTMSNMRSPLLATIGLFLSFTATAQKAADVNAKPIQGNDPSELADLDGRILSTYDRNSKLTYTIANNDSGIEVIVRITDPTAVRQALRAGMYIAIDTLGKKNTAQRIAFPLPMAPPAAQRQGGGQPSSPSKADMVRLNAKFMVSGFVVGNGELTAENAHGIRTRAELSDEQVLTVGYWIPYNALVGHAVDRTAIKRHWSLTTHVNAMQPPSGGGRPEGMGGDRAGGRGEQGGGRQGGRAGGRGGSPGGDQNGGMSSADSSEKQFRVTFAQVP